MYIMLKSNMVDINESASVLDYEEAVFRNLQPGYMISFSMTDEEEDIFDLGEEIEIEVV